MKREIKTITLAAVSVAVLLAAGCGKKGEEKTVAAKPGIQITGNDQMQYNLSEFTVKPGTSVIIMFKNIGASPKQTMGHDLVLLSKGTEPLAFANAGIVHPENGFVDPGDQAKVLAATKILGPGEEDSLKFTAPADTGDYPFVCTFPGHASAGMKGNMHVR